MYSAFVMRYLHKIDEADTKTVDAYEEGCCKTCSSECLSWK